MEESPKKRSFNKNRDGEAASSRKKTTKIAGKSDRGRSSSPKRKNFPKDINDKLEKRRDFADGGERRGDGERKFERRGDGERKFERRGDGERKFERRGDGERKFERRGDGERKFERRGDGERKFERRGDGERKFERRGDGERRFERRGDGERKFERRGDGERKFERRGDGERKFERRGDGERKFERRGDGERRFERRDDGERKFERRGDGERKFERRGDGERKFERRGDGERKPFKKFDDEKPRRKRRDVTAESEILSEIVEKRKREGRQAPQKQKILSLEYEEKYGPIRLNKYIANAGICSRRDADTLITTGAVTVNGQIVTELGTKVMPTDEVRFGDKVLRREDPVYILLNKPKDYITTTYDERDRKDVMELIRGACKERVYPVGRLDKNTTGLLLFTNDGEMAKKLTHPKHNIRKTYHVELDKKLSTTDFNTILEGIELNDGMIQADELAYIGETKREIGITIHSGRNRIVRRVFEHLGYDVIKLDRTVFANLNKKNLPRGKWRFLSEAEINILKMI